MITNKNKTRVDNLCHFRFQGQIIFAFLYKKCLSVIELQTTVISLSFIPLEKKKQRVTRNLFSLLETAPGIFN